ncbi:polyamine-modulated factor 1-binding protein 1 isoform X2 [Denticeps clupeoides]|uniref:polyamine-modulated factor 1-binding protein 1 isoform X2 n=1 Tax=Denticeps clupeoides TaxID=299321 RepID=UPI0010A324FB|nr:polyamine-modulated factor 1-binding protein 1-like isoform X2 [Denticeps clupeoides]
MEPSHHALLHQLREVSLSLQRSKTRVEECEAHIQQLQNTITELHEEISQKDQEKLTQLQQLHHLENRVKALVEQAQISEETVAKLKETSEKTGHSSSQDLDVQEQRVLELQRELQESQLEWRRGHSHIQQLKRELQARQAEELCSQLSQVKGHQAQGEGDNEALGGIKLEHLNAKMWDTASMEESHDTVLEISCRFEEEMREVQERVARLTSRHDSVRQQAVQLRDVELQHTRLGQDTVVSGLHLQEDTSQSLEELQIQCTLQEGKMLAVMAETDCLKGQLETRDRDVASLMLQLHNSQDALKCLTEELQSCRNQMKDQQVQEEMLIARLRAQRQAAVEQKEQLSNELEFQAAELHKLQEELKSRNKQLDQREQDVERLQFREHELQKERDALRKQGSQAEARLLSQDSELVRMKTSLQEAQEAAANVSSSLELHKHKYQACVSRITQLESSLQAREEDLEETRTLAAEQEEQLLRLRAQVAALQGDLRARSLQLESGDDALSAATGSLQDMQLQLQSSRRHAQECELVVRTLRENNAALRRQVEEQEENVVKVQAEFSLHRATHTHPNSDYKSRLCHIQDLEQALSEAVCQCESLALEQDRYQLELQKLKEESSRLTQLRDGSSAEVSTLRVDLQREEQRAARLEEQLEASAKLRAEKEQLEQKKDGILRQSEADLRDARERLWSQGLELEKRATAARGLEAEVRRARKERSRREEDLSSLRAQLLQLREDLKEARTAARDMAQTLARQEEKSVLLEGGQQRAHEQLAERVAEVVRAEQTQRKLQAELRTLKQRLDSTEEERRTCRSELERAEEEAREGRQAQLRAQQECLARVEEVGRLQGELSHSREALETLQQQLKEQVEVGQALRAELSLVRVRTQGAMESEREQLRTKLRSAKSLVKQQEQLIGRLQKEQELSRAHLQQYQKELDSKKTFNHQQSQEVQSCGRQLACAQQWGQQQQDALGAKEEEVVVMKVEMASLREHYHAKVAQVEVLRWSLGIARSDSSLLHRESELVVTSVVQWIQEQKQTNENMVQKIREQSRNIISLIADKDHLQESLETLQQEVCHLKRELNKKKAELLGLRNRRTIHPPVSGCHAVADLPAAADWLECGSPAAS